VAGDFYIFLENFLTQFPNFIGRPIYITGESYAGHYIPAIGSYLVEKVKQKISIKNLINIY
jgi:cathepsin A (carboxypeptidase C)